MEIKHPTRLLAKSYDKKYKEPPLYALLERHTLDVVEAGEKLVKAIGDIAFTCADLNTDDLADFALALKANCFVQDLGKANSDFDKMISAPLGLHLPQLLRHEAISGLLLTCEPLKGWFAQLLRGSKTLHYAALWGAIGHHRKYHRGTTPNNDSPKLTVFTTHDDFKSLLEMMGAQLNLGQPKHYSRDISIAYHERMQCDIVAEDALCDLWEEFKRVTEQITDEKEQRIIALIKAFGIAADVAASAVAKSEYEKENEKRDNSKIDYSLATYIINNLVDPKFNLEQQHIEEVICKRAWANSDCDPKKHDTSQLPPDFVQNSLQKDAALCASADNRLALINAGCGSGKSLAAYYWAREWCARINRERQATDVQQANFRLFFLLPTTGTATEQYKDYALASGIENIALTHSRYQVDLEQLAQTAVQEDAREDSKNPAADALKAQLDKIEALNLWSTALIVGTADTVLGLMANSLRSICSLPAILSGAIVFDEIHAYDQRMFGHLLVFLKNFPRLPVLLMTASLPEPRRIAIERVRSDLHVIPSLQEFEILHRYLINDTASEDEVWRAIEDCVRAGGKVLWVRNQVEWANETYQECCKRFESLGVYVDVYHSRFRYLNRVTRHNSVIRKFKEDKQKEDKQAVILVATQVAEMSLDLSADLLITDIAPISSLIQRLGRLNRLLRPKDIEDGKLPEEYCKWAYVRPLPSDKPTPEKPYEKEDFEKARTWLEKLASTESKPCPLNQQDLAQTFVECDGEANNAEFDFEEAEEDAVFFSGLWETRVGMTRGAGYTISVIWQPDYEKWRGDNPKARKPEREWLRKHEVSITFRDEILKWEGVGSVPIAPSDKIDYVYFTDENGRERGTGARWIEKGKR